MIKNIQTITVLLFLLISCRPAAENRTISVRDIDTRIGTDAADAPTAGIFGAGEILKCK